VEPKRNGRTHRAIETRAVVIVVQSFDPSVAGLDRETAGNALGREQFVPICAVVLNYWSFFEGARRVLTVFAIRQAVLQKERTVAEELAAVRAVETFGMELFADGVQTILRINVSSLHTVDGGRTIDPRRKYFRPRNRACLNRP